MLCIRFAVIFTLLQFARSVASPENLTENDYTTTNPPRSFSFVQEIYRESLSEQEQRKDTSDDQKLLFVEGTQGNSSSSSSTPAPTNAEIALSNIVIKMQENPGLNSGIEAILVLVVMQTMLGLGCTIDLSLMKEHLFEPKGIAIAAACQFGIMPLVAFALAKMFSLDKVAAIAVLVTGSCPGGNLSNILAYFLYGDMTLSVLMSTVSTLLALILMPLCLFVYGSGWINVGVIGSMVPFGGVALTLILTLLPVCAGVAIKMKYEKMANTVLKVSLFSVGVSFIALMTLSGILFGRDLFAAISGTSYVIAVVMPLIGYGSGYLLATGFRLPDASRRTVAVETGCQNSQLSSTILKMAFARQTMGAYFLFPLYYALFQGMEGLIMVFAFRVYRKYYADETLAPAHTRITYDKFDGSWGTGVDGEDSMPPRRLYQQSSSSDDSVYGMLDPEKGDSCQAMRYSRHTALTSNNKMQPDGSSSPQKCSDKASLMKHNGQLATAMDYGGLGENSK